MADRRVWISLVAVALLAGYSQFRVFQLDRRLGDVTHLPEALSAQASESTKAIEGARDQALKSLHDTVASDLLSAAKTISDQQARALEDRLRQLAIEVSKREAAVRSAEAERDRLQNGLPEHVDLDQLNAYYAELWKKETGYASTVESFNTSLGPIGFRKSHFTFAYIPSSRQLAWLKIGKDESGENSELIKAWLEEAGRAKMRLGYVQQYRRTKPSDYGESTETRYTKGDMYFKTFMQYQRVQGTYGRHSLQYTYYVETGSDARRKEYELEQYNKKLGG
jgi:hypothetical protein